LNTEDIKNKIPEWLTRSEIDRLKSEFVSEEPEFYNSFESVVSNPKNWKRIIKKKVENGIERVFDCKPLDDQLRFYIITNNEDIIEHYFSAE
jgi:hypothetical protein